MQGSIEPGNDAPPSQFIYISNSSTVEIIVRSPTLSECENIRGACSTQHVRIRVPAGGRTMVRKVDARLDNLASSFRFHFTWHADSSDAEVMRLLAEAGMPGASGRRDPARADTVIKAFTPSVEMSVEEPVVVRPSAVLEDSALASLGERLEGIRASRFHRDARG